MTESLAEAIALFDRSYKGMKGGGLKISHRKHRADGNFKRQRKRFSQNLTLWILREMSGSVLHNVY